MTDVEKSVREFHEAFELPIGDKPEFLEDVGKDGLRMLRMVLLEEEFDEYWLGEMYNNIEEVADALADIVYIAVGTAIAYGIPFNEVFEEIHRSNMSKLGEDNKPIYREDGKVMKGPNYTPPDLKKILGK